MILLLPFSLDVFGHIKNFKHSFLIWTINAQFPQAFEGSQNTSLEGLKSETAEGSGKQREAGLSPDHLPKPFISLLKTPKFTESTLRQAVFDPSHIYAGVIRLLIIVTNSW